MLTLSPTTMIYLAAGATDMRKSFNTLAGLTRSTLALNPASGHFFVFCNRRRNRLKILFWDGTGYWVMAKRLERGRFSWPGADCTQPVQLRSQELAPLLGGVDLGRSCPGDWRFRREPARPPSTSGVAAAKRKLEQTLLILGDPC